MILTLVTSSMENSSSLWFLERLSTCRVIRRSRSRQGREDGGHARLVIAMIHQWICSVQSNIVWILCEEYCTIYCVTPSFVTESRLDTWPRHRTLTLARCRRQAEYLDYPHHRGGEAATIHTEDYLTTKTCVMEMFLKLSVSSINRC